ncbi:hypothetical protein [Endozoicomonas arenosclerae]|uniref:hypothetical protein n=1 Tax=Endozoicomonas arenosclerae TaxID=1633495 RepID=UPI000784CED4|nr:hypothetical protein [Endozoicomonas arenosclerae]
MNRLLIVVLATLLPAMAQASEKDKPVTNAQEAIQYAKEHRNNAGKKEVSGDNWLGIANSAVKLLGITESSEQEEPQRVREEPDILDQINEFFK